MPGLTSAADVDLSVLPTSLSMQCDRLKHFLPVTLHKTIDPDNVKAKLKKASSTLKITLPIA